MQSQDEDSDGYQPLPGSSSGHRYKRVKISGHARAHLGDYYVGTLHQYGQSNDVASNPVAKQQMILEHLCHADMDRRSTNIHELGGSACKWAFEPLTTPLAPWLEKQEGGIFWITGKAGSGKSTFMKFLARHSTTQALLGTWAGTKRLIVAEHYFWYSTANDLQKSFEGMLRGLLHAVLREIPDTIPSLLPIRWAQASHRLHTAWTEAELLQALCGLGALQDERFALFLDGLDECVPSQNHGTLVRHLETIARSSNIKLCVSSRPWQTFETHFGVLGNHLALQDYTLTDMVSYISSKLIEAELDTGLYTCFSEHEPKADSLVKQIAQKAEGVFLWTVLIVKSLCEEIEAGRSVEDLHCYLEETPLDLKKFFTTMILERIGHRNKSAVARFLKCTTILARASMSQGKLDGRSTPRNWHMSFLNFSVLFNSNEAENQNFASQADARPLYLEDMKASFQQTRRYIGRMSRDLLHYAPTIDGVQDPATMTANDKSSFARCWNILASCKVEFLHRTVFDYLLDTDIESLLDQHVPGHFQRSDFIARITLARLKLYPKLRPGHAFPLPVSIGANKISIFKDGNDNIVGWHQELGEREELQTHLHSTPLGKNARPCPELGEYFSDAVESLSHSMIHKRYEARPPYDVDCCRLSRVDPRLVTEYEEVVLIWSRCSYVRHQQAADFSISLISYGFMHYVRQALPLCDDGSVLAMMQEAVSTLICYPTTPSHASTLSTLLENRRINKQWIVPSTTSNAKPGGWWPVLLSFWVKVVRTSKVSTPSGDIIYSEEISGALEDHVFTIASALCRQGHDVFAYPISYTTGRQTSGRDSSDAAERSQEHSERREEDQQEVSFVELLNNDERQHVLEDLLARSHEEIQTLDSAINEPQGSELGD